jgi:phosphinothricin acetyltransferase
MGVRLIDCDRSRAPRDSRDPERAIEHSTALYDYRPRTMAMMESWFDAKEKGQYPVIGAVDDQNRLLGFASYGPFRNWPAYKYSVEHSVYVDKDCRGRGIGTMLLEAIIARARLQQYHNVIGGIDATNGVSIALHTRFGFEFCGRVKLPASSSARWLDLDFYQLILDTLRNPWTADARAPASRRGDVCARGARCV